MLSQMETGYLEKWDAEEYIQNTFQTHNGLEFQFHDRNATEIIRKQIQVMQKSNISS